MGFNKRHIDKHRIISAFKSDGAKGVTDLFNADAIFMPTDSPVCHYIDKIMSKDETVEYKQNLIDVYMTQLLEGLYKFK
jgi:hypothetical protein